MDPLQNVPADPSDERYVNPLNTPARHPLPVLLRELRFGRPASAQQLLTELAEITEQERWVLDDAGELAIVPKPNSP